MKNKRGDFTGMLYLIVMISAFAIFLLIAGYVAIEINTGVKNQINSTNEDVQHAFDSSIAVSQHTLSAVWYIMFGGLLLGLLITAWYIPTHPIFVPIFIILLVVAIIIGVAMSNAYEELYNMGTLAEISATQNSIYFIMSNLPYIALAVGLITLIITFAKPKGENNVSM